MIWNHWTTRQLQTSLDEVDPELYDNIKGGLVYKYFNLAEKSNYYTMKDVEAWEEAIIDESLENPDVDYIKTSYWKLDQYSVILVRRDRDFWDKLIVSMEELWNKVLECRRMGCEAYIEKYNKEQSLRADYKPKKPRAKKNYSFGKDYEVPLLPDSEDEATPQKGNLEMYDI